MGGHASVRRHCSTHEPACTLTDVAATLSTSKRPLEGPTPAKRVMVPVEEMRRTQWLPVSAIYTDDVIGSNASPVGPFNAADVAAPLSPANLGSNGNVGMAASTGTGALRRCLRANAPSPRQPR